MMNHNAMLQQLPVGITTRPFRLAHAIALHHVDLCAVAP
jgi:hypothetical protein